MKIVYTCITGNYDKLHVPLIHNSNWTHICFTDNPFLLEKERIYSYKILPVENNLNLDPVRLARMYKILGLGVNDVDYIVWHDANLQISCDLDMLLSKHLKDDTQLVLSKHPRRNCLYNEANKCIKLGKDSKDIIDNQVNHYIDEGMPYSYGLYETGFLIRRKFSNDIFYRKWWEEVQNYSRRDQISFPYCTWKYLQFAPKINTINNLRDYFIKVKHQKNEFGGKY